MVETGDARFGPHSAEVRTLLDWIDSGELLRFGKPLVGPFIPVSEFDEALAIAQGRRGGSIDWTDARENADAALYEIGLLDQGPRIKLPPAWRAP